MKKILMAAAAFSTLAAVPAYAGNIHIGFYTAPPVVYRPAPVAYAPVYYAPPRPVHYAPRMAYAHPHKFKHGYNVAYYDAPRRGHWR